METKLDAQVYKEQVTRALVERIAAGGEVPETDWNEDFKHGLKVGFLAATTISAATALGFADSCIYDATKRAEAETGEEEAE